MGLNLYKCPPRGFYVFNILMLCVYECICDRSEIADCCKDFFCAAKVKPECSSICPTRKHSHTHAHLHTSLHRKCEQAKKYPIKQDKQACCQCIFSFNPLTQVHTHALTQLIMRIVKLAASAFLNYTQPRVIQIQNMHVGDKERNN